MSKAELIKQKCDIVTVAERYGAQPHGTRSPLNTKHNPLRDEKTSSLKLYTDTNSYMDFGSNEGGSVIDFVMEADGCDYPDAVETLLRMFSLSEDSLQKTIHNPILKSTRTDYISHKAVKHSFLNSQDFVNINHKEHGQILETITPKYVLDMADEDDYMFYFENVKYSKSNNTAVVLLQDSKGMAHTYRFRNRVVGDELKKWVALAGSRSNYLYCRLNNNPITLIVEGTRDYLNALLCGYSVIALPSANYKEIDAELLQDRLCIFMDDDDDKGSMLELFNKSICNKIWFEHKKFKEITKCNSKDFSDYLYQFKDLGQFKKTFEDFILTLKTKVKDWREDINLANLVTAESLEEAPENEALIDGFIFKNTSTVIHSNPGAGKSSLILALIKDLIKSEKINSAIYFDADNPQSVLKDRLPKVQDKKLFYWSSTRVSFDDMKNEMYRLISYKQQGRDVLIVIDTAGRFVDGSVKNDNEVLPILKIVNDLVNEFGATVILVHHSNKAKDDDGKPVFQGSQRIMGDTDATWGLVRKGSVITAYQNKVRFGGMFDFIEFEVDNQSLELISTVGKYESDIEVAHSGEFDEFEILNYLKDASNKPFSGAIKKRFGAGVEEFMQLFEGKMWDTKTVKHGKLYVPKTSISPTVTEYSDDMEMPTWML